MKLSQFKFKLPEELIAQYPTENRDECRLMVVNVRDKSIEHILEYMMLNALVTDIDHHQTTFVAVFRRILCDKFLRKFELEL